MLSEADHGRHEFQRPYTNRDIGIVETLHDFLLILGDHVRMSRDDLDHGKESNVSHCITLSSGFIRMRVSLQF